MDRAVVHLIGLQDSPLSSLTNVVLCVSPLRCALSRDGAHCLQLRGFWILLPRLRAAHDVRGCLNNCSLVLKNEENGSNGRLVFMNARISLNEEDMLQAVGMR